MGPQSCKKPGCGLLLYSVVISLYFPVHPFQIVLHNTGISINSPFIVFHLPSLLSIWLCECGHSTGKLLVAANRCPKNETSLHTVSWRLGPDFCFDVFSAVSGMAQECQNLSALGITSIQCILVHSSYRYLPAFLPFPVRINNLSVWHLAIPVIIPGRVS